MVHSSRQRCFGSLWFWGRSLQRSSLNPFKTRTSFSREVHKSLRMSCGFKRLRSHLSISVRLRSEPGPPKTWILLFFSHSDADLLLLGTSSCHVTQPQLAHRSPHICLQSILEDRGAQGVTKKLKKQSKSSHLHHRASRWV